MTNNMDTSPLRSASTELLISTSGISFVEFTSKVENWVSQINATGGLLTVFVRHTSASLTIQENADPSVLKDLTDSLDAMAPQNHPYRHSQEGPDDMPAHIKSMLTATSLSIPIINGTTALGTWQGVYLIEHRTSPHNRKVVLQYIGSTAT